MGIIAHLRGLMGLQGPAGTLSSLLALTFTGGVWVVGATNSSLSFNSATSTVTFLVAGYYILDWKNPATFKAANSTLVLGHGTHQIFGPLS